MTCDVTAPSTRGCFMTQGLYLKANGELPCWDDVGESRILRKLDPERLAAGLETDLSRFEALNHIRASFAAGRLPHPGLCEGCAVRSAGLPAEEIDPSVLQVLHVEPSWMCHLSCPQCIPQKLRKSLKGPPYHLTPEMFEGFLKQLRAEGIAQIKLVIFEGRGDPLTCPHMEQLLALTKEYYPRSSTSITTHGSFPYKDWIAASKLDVIRFSVDGARQENYEKYRINGKLDKIFEFMASLQRDRPAGSQLYAEWKYILFEWNDSDEELAEAADLASKLGVQLRFCRTHTPGRSTRLATAGDVADMIRRVAPRALQDLTFQLKDDDDFSQVDVVRMDQIRGLISMAEDRARSGDEVSACAALGEILQLDGGVVPAPPPVSTYAEAEDLMLEMSGRIALSETAGLLAGLFHRLGRQAPVKPLLLRYLDLAPEALDHRHVTLDVGMLDLLAAHEQADAGAVDHAAAQLLGAEEGSDLLSSLGRILQLDHPGVAVGLANVFEARRQMDPAILLFERYLDLAPDASDYAQVARHVAGLRRERSLERAVQQHRAGNGGAVPGLACAAVAADLAASEGEGPSLKRLVGQAASPHLILALGSLAAEASDFETAYLAEKRLREMREAG